jgi:prepilin-type N-terminal cleavage/methylation domain-containing protein
MFTLTNVPTARRKGFTVIELLAVMTIVGVASALSLGKFSSIVARQRVNKAAYAVSNDVQLAFAIAGRNRRPVRVVWDATQLQLTITNRAQDTVFRRTGLGAGAGFNLTSADIAVYPPSNTPLEIFPNGLATDTMSITLSANGAKKRVWVSKAGLVDMR